MVQYVGNIPEHRIAALEIEDFAATRREVLDFIGELKAVGLAPRSGVAVSVLPAFGGAPGLAYFRIVPTVERSAQRGYGVKTPSGERSEHAGPRPEGVGGFPSRGRDRLGDELRKCIVPRSGALKAHT